MAREGDAKEPAACAATCLPRRAGVPPTATWRVQPEPDSTPRRETLRGRWRDRRAADRRHPRQRLLRREIPARPCVRDERLPQIGSALAAEVAAVADLRPELLGRVTSAARGDAGWAGFVSRSGGRCDRCASEER